MLPDLSTAPSQSVIIVVPVFRDLEVTRNCLEALIASKLPVHASIAVINDSSPEAELGTYCRELAARVGCNLIVNDSNLGFVKSANKGFALDTAADILLLNSDTVVSAGWLQRLQSCAYRDEKIGTVTPFSNNGTICSYPVFPISNPLPAGWNTAELDRAFQVANAGVSHEIPTAVGFCMYIKRACLHETGPFDEANFGHGYGEECDFSLRASALGWKHAVAADVFVYHAGGASFAAESTQRKRNADKVMSTLHPGYNLLISDFLQSDPLYVYRRNVDAVRLRDRPTDAVAILEEHYRYSRTILEREIEIQQAILSEQEQRRLIEQLLNDCRQQFTATDQELAAVQAGLAQAERIVDNLNKDMADARIYAQQLLEHIRNMEQSRSWRYTAWLRRR
jgi:GT2 family glycosyltransferase